MLPAKTLNQIPCIYIKLSCTYSALYLKQKQQTTQVHGESRCFYRASSRNSDSLLISDKQNGSPLDGAMALAST